MTRIALASLFWSVPMAAITWHRVPIGLAAVAAVIVGWAEWRRQRD